MKTEMRKIVCLILTVIMLMTCGAVMLIPAAFAENVNTETKFSEDFEGYTVTNSFATAMPELWEDDWFIANETQMYTTKDFSL